MQQKSLGFNPCLSIKITAVLLGTIALYWQDLIMVAKEALQSELSNHILGIPIILGYLIYRKRKMLKAVIPFQVSKTRRKAMLNKEIIGATICLLAFLLYWHGSYTFHPLEYHLISLPIFTAGLILITFNTETLKVLIFPLAFLLFLVPPPLEIVYTLGTNLSTISSQTAYTTLKAIGLPVTLTAQYETPIITVTKPGSSLLTFAVDIACAGLYPLIGFTAFAVFTTYIARGNPLKKTVMFLVSFPLIYLLSIIRIVITILIGTQYGMQTAMQTFHLLGGFTLIFLGTALLLTLSEKILKIQLFTTKPKMMACNYCNPNPENKEHFCPACGRILNPMDNKLSKQDIAKISLITIAAILILNLQVPVFALTEGTAQINTQTLGGQQTTTQILPEIPGYTTKFAYRDKRFEELAKQDASLAYEYKPTEKTKATIWVTLEIAQTRSSLHRWEVCLITWRLTRGIQPTVTQLSLRDIQILQNPPITARYFAFQDKKSQTAQVVLYWYENAYFNTTRSLEQKNIKISLIAFAKNPEEVPKIEETLLPFAKAIANHWQPIKTWSQTALTIAQHGTLLMTITTLPLAIALSYQILENHIEKKSNMKIYSKLASEEEKLILKAVHQANHKDKPTANTIAIHYQKLTGKPIEMQLLLQKLSEAEENDLIRGRPTSMEDEPVLTWTSRMALQEAPK